MLPRAFNLFLLLVLITSTVLVHATALVAEFMATPAGHVVAALSASDPEVALRALLELHAPHEFQELPIGLAWIGVELVVLACHVVVVLNPTFEAVPLLAHHTGELVACSSF